MEELESRVLYALQHEPPDAYFVSYDSLVQTVWESPQTKSRTSLAQYVSRLRKKGYPIRNYRGQGYHLFNFG